MNMKFVAAGLALALGVGFTVDAVAQGKPETMVKQRQAAMTLQAKYFGPLGAMAQGKAPYNASVVARNAGYLEILTKLAWDGFAPETANVKSRALPEIYKDTAGFNAEIEKLQAGVAKLVAAAKSSNESAAKAATGDIGKVCGSCHKKYRQSR